jgi:hypothetical protein
MQLKKGILKSFGFRKDRFNFRFLLSVCILGRKDI